MLSINTQKAKGYFEDNQFDNILRLFDVLPNFLFTKIKMIENYYLEIWYIRVVSRVPEQLNAEELRKLGNIRQMSKVHRMTA